MLLNGIHVLLQAPTDLALESGAQPIPDNEKVHKGLPLGGLQIKLGCSLHILAVCSNNAGLLACSTPHRLVAAPGMPCNVQHSSLQQLCLSQHAGPAPWRLHRRPHFAAALLTQAQIKQLLTGLMLSTPPLIRAQLSEALTLISGHDFPAAWPQLLPELVERLSGEISWLVEC